MGLEHRRVSQAIDRSLLEVSLRDFLEVGKLGALNNP